MAVAPEPTLWWGVASEVPSDLGALDRANEREFQTMLDRAVRAIPPDVRVTQLLGRGAAAEAILAGSKRDLLGIERFTGQQVTTLDWPGRTWLPAAVVPAKPETDKDHGNAAAQKGGSPHAGTGEPNTSVRKTP